MKHPFYGQTDSFQVIGNTFLYYKRHFIPLFLISFIINLITQYPLHTVFPLEKYQTPADTKFVNSAILFDNNRLIIWILAIVAYTIGYLCITYYAVYQKETKKIPLVRLLKNALLDYYGKFLVVLFISGFLFVCGTFIGVIFFIIGMIFTFFYFSTVLLPAVPILITENRSPVESISRSFRLSHHNFISAFGSWVLFLLVLFIVSLALSFFAFLPNIIRVISTLVSEGGLFEFFEHGFVYEHQSAIVTYVVHVLTSAIMFPLFPVFTVALYFRLKFYEDTYIVH